MLNGLAESTGAASCGPAFTSAFIFLKRFPLRRYSLPDIFLKRGIVYNSSPIHDGKSYMAYVSYFPIKFSPGTLSIILGIFRAFLEWVQESDTGCAI